MTRGEMVLGAKRLGYRGETTRVENRGETTRGETTRGEMSWGRNVLLPERHTKNLHCCPNIKTERNMRIYNRTSPKIYVTKTTKHKLPRGTMIFALTIYETIKLAIILVICIFNRHFKHEEG